MTPHREHQLLRGLEKLSAQRAKSETEIITRRKTARGESDKKRDDATTALRAWLQTAEQDIARRFTEQTQQAASRFAQEIAALERSFVEFQFKLDAQFEPLRQQAQQALEAGYKQAESQFDARKKLAPSQLADFEQQLEAWRVRIREDREEAQKLLTKWRMTSFGAGLVKPFEETEASGDLAAQLQERLNIVGQSIAELKKLHSPSLSKSWLLKLSYPVISAILAGLAWQFEMEPIVIGAAGIIPLVVGISLSLLFRSLARGSVRELYPQLCRAASEAESLMKQSLSAARVQTGHQQTKLGEQRERARQTAEKLHQQRVAEINAQRDAKLVKPSQTLAQRKGEIAVRRDQALAQAEADRKQNLKEFVRRKEHGEEEIEATHVKELAEIEQKYAERCQRLLEWWQQGLAKLEVLTREIRGENISDAGHCWLADWKQLPGGKWTPVEAIPAALRFGEFRIGMDQVRDGVPKLPLLAEATPSEIVLPALVPFPDAGSLLFKARGAGRQAAIQAMQAFMLRLVVLIPPAKLRFTIFDPVGLGENFSGFMHLADYNEALVTNRIWTEVPLIEQRLTDLSEHMENVIQKYLRNEYANIEQYNREAGEIAEPYRFLVIANFPANFSEAAQRRLLSIAASGSRCGVYTVIMADTQMPLRTGVTLKDLEQHATTLNWTDGKYVWKDDIFGKFPLTLDAPPPPADVTDIITTGGEQAKHAGKVEVPFRVIAPRRQDFWTNSAARELDVPLGRAGATRFQGLRLGRGTSQHVLIAGKTGSGKSTLLHILITNAALRYSPDELELYLIDFKQGVEFKTYATCKLPHARVIAVESDREFGVSVLQRLDAEIKIRADRYRAAGVQDLGGFRAAEPNIPMPRALLIIDEFQEFFVEDDKAAQDAALLLDRLVRQGRAFGIHVLLGSQTLAGAFSVGRSTLGQMAIRIALQCSEADSQLILSEDNSAARLLSRPGEAIYNDANGMVEGNHPFQIVWLTEEARDEFLGQVSELVVERQFDARPQLVFEGNLPAELPSNEKLVELLTNGRPQAAPHEGVVWLGDAVAIKDPTSLALRPQSGSNMLIVGQNEDAAIGIFLTTVMALAAQYPNSDEAGPRFFVFDGSNAGSPHANLLATLPALTPDPVKVVGRRDLAATINLMAREVERRQRANTGEQPLMLLMIYGLHKLREFWKSEDDYSFGRAGAEFATGPWQAICHAAARWAAARRSHGGLVRQPQQSEPRLGTFDAPRI